MRYDEPEFQPWDGRRVPLTFIAGYLGAGKTTLINRLLEITDRPIAIVVNDVGEINIDARLIRKHQGDTIELTDGCICCSLVDGFGAVFDQLRARAQPPDHVVVELSGVADPARVLPWGRSAGFRLDGVMTLAAADQIVELSERADIGSLVAAQLAAADLVAITKMSTPETIASEPQIHELIASVAGSVPVLRVEDGNALGAVLHMGGRRPGGIADVPAATLFDRHRVQRIPLPNPVEVADIETIIDNLPASVMRAKAIAVDGQGQRWAVQVVGRRRTISRLPLVEAGDPTDLIAIEVI